MTLPHDMAAQFRALHRPGAPLVLFNVWDAGSAAAVVRGGARAIGTSSWALAAAQGLPDGESLPLEEVLTSAARIVAAVDLPVTVDFEGGFAREASQITANLRRLAELGVAGLNFEDEVVNGPGLYPLDEQVARLQAARRGAEGSFLNARTDLFLKAPPGTDPAGLMDEAIARAAAYAAAGADGFFVPGLSAPDLIAQLCATVALPVNVMTAAVPGTVAAMRALGVARISLGPAPYLAMTAALTERAAAFA